MRTCSAPKGLILGGEPPKGPERRSREGPPGGDAAKGPRMPRGRHGRVLGGEDQPLACRLGNHRERGGWVGPGEEQAGKNPVRYPVRFGG